MIRHRIATATVLLALASLAAGGVLLAKGPAGKSPDEKQALAGANPSFLTERELGEGNAAWDAFRNRHPGEWQSVWDVRTGIPAVLYGPGIDSGRRADDEAAAVGIAADLATEHADLFGLTPFELEGNTLHGGNTWYVDFALVHQGIRLEEHTRFGLRIKENGVVAALKAYSIPHEVEAARPTIAAPEAVSAVEAGLVENRSDLRLANEPALWYVVDGEGVARLAWRFEIRGSDLTDPFAREYFVHARGSAEILQVNERIWHDHSGDVSANAVLGATNDPPVATVIREARVTYTSGGSGSTYTDVNGDFSFPSGTGTATIRSRMDGMWSNVNNSAGSDIEQSITAGAGDNFHFFHNSTPSEYNTAQTTAFYWVTEIHNWSHLHQGDNGVEYEIPTNVNINSSCNAYYDGSSINFYRSGGGCPNMAHDATVVLHEYGHGIDDGHGGILDGSYSEGFSDAVANALTNQPCAGIDFFGPGTCLRSAENVRLWPAPECSGEVHCEGEVLAQVDWKFYTNLVGTIGDPDARLVADQIILWADLANPVDIPDGVFEMFVADDDDGTLLNGTPHFFELADAADSRLVPRPPDPLDPIGQCGIGAVNAGVSIDPPAFFDDMEGGAGPWWSHGAMMGTDDWAVGVSPWAHSPANAWKCIADTTYTDKWLAFTVDVAAPATDLQFWHTWYFENGNYDGAVLEISTNGGSTFTQLDGEIVEGGYTGTISTSFGNPLGGRHAWVNGSFADMTRVTVDLSSYQGSGRIIRFRFGSDSCCGPGSSGGWHIDDVGVWAPSPCGNRTDVLFVNRELPTVTLADDMEGGVQPFWSHGASVGSDDWLIRTTSNAHSPTHAWTCIDDTTYTDKWLKLTTDLTATENALSFWHSFSFESGNYDGAILEISTNGGATYSQLTSQIVEGGYTGSINGSFGNPLGSVPAWVGNSSGFPPMSLVRVDLSSFAPATGAILRFRVGTDSCCGPGSAGGWQIDDVTIGSLGTSGTGGTQRTIYLSQTDPLHFYLDEPPARLGDGQGTDACIYLWKVEPTESDIVTLPKGLGTMCFGLYVQPPTVMPYRIFNGIGVESKLGPNSGGPNPPGITEGGNFEFFTKLSGAGRAVKITLQGVIEDPCSIATKPYSVTNGVLLVIQ